MTTKSIIFTVAATAGMVAVADVWDVKFTLKTVANDKKASVTLKGAWDDSAQKYTFWNSKTGVQLKDIAFAVANETSYGKGKNAGRNAQLVWGDLENPDGLLVAAGFGSKKSTSGQAAGTLGGVPAAGTWSLKKSTKSYDALAKAATDVAANNEALEKARRYLKAGEALDTVDEAVAKAAAAEANLETVKAAAIETQETLERTAGELEKATADLAAAEAAKTAAEEALAKSVSEEEYAAAKTELDAANKALDELAAVTNAIAETLSNAANNEGLVEEARTLYQTEVRNFIANTLNRVAAASLVEEGGNNVTNAMILTSNLLVSAVKDYNETNERKNNLQSAFKDWLWNITYSNDLEYVLYPDWDIITNKTTGGYRDVVLAGTGTTIGNVILGWNPVDLVATTNATYGAWVTATNKMDIANKLLETKVAAVDAAYAAYVTDGTPANLSAWEAAKEAALKAETNDVFIATTNLAKCVENRDAAVEAINDFKAEKDIAEMKAKIKEYEDALAAIIKEADGMTKAEFDATMKDEDAKFVAATNEIETIVGKFDDWRVATVIPAYAGKVELPIATTWPVSVDLDWSVIDDIGNTFDQDKWDNGKGAGVYGGVVKTLALLDEAIAKNEVNIKAAQDLAELLKIDSFATEKFTKTLQDGFAIQLKDKEKAPIVVEAAKKWGITLESKVK